ncbi:hypothetical protein PPYR_13615 [Photinus pyralis]|uniref:DNA repair protein RAD51 homolog 3 n=3 Tax=Photinus pyralis TaxID=7054 RepID=A0A5N4A9J5_PHOPY|nr:DNA repair protein RAD51 homolog 3-like [Photinus pyralis]KAB0793995.1 hypothetical protein PPYR_13615 [Photinus pyralis]
MYQPINSLDIPENKMQELKSTGYYHCKDVDTDNPLWDVLTRTPETKTALDLYHEEQKMGSIRTFIDHFDDALGGGIPIGKITEFCGESGTGKTQLCFQLCVTVQLPSWCGGLDGAAVFLSTNQSFATHRIRQIALGVVNHYEFIKTKHLVHRKRKVEELCVDKIMGNISHIYITDHIELMAVLIKLKQFINDHPMVRLVVIDSISAPLKTLNGQERTTVVFNFFREVQRLSQEFCFAIVITNDLTTRIGSGSAAYQTPSLGGSYYHRINLRVELEKKSSPVFKAIITKNALKPEREIEFTLLA